MKYLLDTNVYVDAFRSEGKKAQFRKSFFPRIPATFLSAIVAYELYINAWNRDTRKLIKEFLDPMERSGRVVTPTFDDWIEAAAIVAAIKEKNRGLRSKLPALLNDILIVLCALRIGATLITHNRDDFLLIRRHKVFSLEILGSSATQT